MKLNFLFVHLLVFVTFRLDAQNVINTDRPDVSDGTHLVEKQQFQVESGIQFSKLDEQTKGLNNVTLLRYGVSKKFEIRFLNEYSVLTDSNSIEGIKPPTIGFKNELCKQKGLLPKLTLVSYFNLPITINSNFTGTSFGYTFTLAARHELNKVLKVYSNIGVSQDQQSKDISYLATLELNFSVLGNLSSFIEYFGKYEPNTNASNGIDIGFIYALKNNFSIDISTGSSTLNLTSNRFVSIGMSLRLPSKLLHQKNSS